MFLGLPGIAQITSIEYLYKTLICLFGDEPKNENLSKKNGGARSKKSRNIVVNKQNRSGQNNSRNIISRPMG
jgi:hypothetical protein